MKEYSVNIAGYRIMIESSDFELVPGKRFEKFRLKFPGQANPGDKVIPPTDRGERLLLRVFSGGNEVPAEATRVFHAPYMEEAGGIRFHRSQEFWSVWKHRDTLFIKTSFPETAGLKSALLKFTSGSYEWELRLQGDISNADPFEYPLDGLILYYLTVLHGDIMIHASGVDYMDQGLIFSGISGKGKTTMSKIWESAGARVIHDDRLIIRQIGDTFRFYNTPVYDNDEPRESQLSRIFLIEHGKENSLVRVKGATAISLFMANCIQQNWGQEIISSLLGAVSAVCAGIPVYRLEFTPDRSVIDHLLKNGQ